MRKEPSRDSTVIKGKPIKKLAVNLDDMDNALDLNDELAELFAAKAGNDPFDSLPIPRINKATP